MSTLERLGLTMAFGDVLMAMICSNNCSIIISTSGWNGGGGMVVVVFNGENSTSSLHLHLPPIQQLLSTNK